MPEPSLSLAMVPISSVRARLSEGQGLRGGGFPFPGGSAWSVPALPHQVSWVCGSEGANPNTPPGDHLSPPRPWQGQAEGPPKQRPSLVDQAGRSEAGGSPLPFQRS